MITHSKQLTQAITTGKTRHLRTLRPLKPGHDYPLHTQRSKPAACRVTIHATIQQQAGDITLKQAMLEGFKTTAAFKAHWVQAHDKQWVKRQPSTPDEHVLIARFDQRHAHTPTWVHTLTPVVDQPRYLASQRDILTGHCDTQGYTSRKGRAIDDLEVVDPAITDQWARQAAPFAEAQRKAARAVQQDTRQRYRNQRIGMLRRAS